MGGSGRDPSQQMICIYWIFRSSNGYRITTQESLPAHATCTPLIALKIKSMSSGEVMVAITSTTCMNLTRKLYTGRVSSILRAGGRLPGPITVPASSRTSCTSLAAGTDRSGSMISICFRYQLTLGAKSRLLGRVQPPELVWYSATFLINYIFLVAVVRMPIASTICTRSTRRHPHGSTVTIT